MATDPGGHSNNRKGIMRRSAWAAAAAFLGCIIAANYVTEHYGLIWGIGGMVTAGTYFAGATFTLRDAIHEWAGRWAVLALIAVGAGLSWFVSSGTTALASGVAFLVAETADLAVYEPLRRRRLDPRAVFVSGLVGAAVDTWLFLTIAGFPASGRQIAAQVATKLAMVVGVLALLAVRRREIAPA